MQPVQEAEYPEKSRRSEDRNGNIIQQFGTIHSNWITSCDDNHAPRSSRRTESGIQSDRWALQSRLRRSTTNRWVRGCRVSEIRQRWAVSCRKRAPPDDNKWLTWRLALATRGELYGSDCRIVGDGECGVRNRIQSLHTPRALAGQTLCGRQKAAPALAYDHVSDPGSKWGSRLGLKWESGLPAHFQLL